MSLSQRDDAVQPNMSEDHSLRSSLEEGFIRSAAWLAVTFYRLTGDWLGCRPLLSRTTAHLAIIVVTIVAIGLSDVEWPVQAAYSPVSALSASGVDKGEREPVNDVLTSLNVQSGEAPARGNPESTQVVLRLAQPQTIIPVRPRLEVITYTVQVGDTVQSIAALFNLQPTTIMWANPAVEDAPDLLRVGQEVVILPVDGAYHTVAQGDTLHSIAEEYEVKPEAIATCQYNALEPPDYPIGEGMRLVIPGGEKPYVPKAVTAYAGPVPEGARGLGQFQWPVLGRITQGYWYGHRAIDIGAPTGSAVLAADGGFVSFAGWTDVGYGYLIVVDHANGFATYYAHLSNMYVFEGQSVDRGQVVGAVGSTGWSTGPHLHFEVRYQGMQQNPRAYLP